MSLLLVWIYKELDSGFLTCEVLCRSSELVLESVSLVIAQIVIRVIVMNIGRGGGKLGTSQKDWAAGFRAMCRIDGPASVDLTSWAIVMTRREFLHLS